MIRHPVPKMISVFTPSFADEDDTNAQNLSVKEIVARLDPEAITVTMLYEKCVDRRIASRPNTRLLRWHKHGNTVRILGQILKQRPDLYFFPREGPLDMAFLRFRRYLGLKTAIVSYVVSGGLESSPYFATRQRHIREADAVVANNSYLARLLVEKMGVAVSSVIYDGVDRRFFYSNGVTNRGSEVSVLFAGSFRPLKRAPLVIRQAAQFPEVRFRLAGSGEEEQVCKNLAAELGCKNVEFLGHLSQQQLGEVMREADIFFFPSILEGHPQVLVQAAASGLPVIAMNVYRPDYVRNGITGFLVDADEDLSSKLEELIGNRENREAMGKAAVEHVRQFDWDTIAKTWQDLFTHTVTHRQQHCLRTSTA